MKRIIIVILFVFILGCATTRPTAEDNIAKYKKMVHEYDSAVKNQYKFEELAKNTAKVINGRCDNFVKGLSNEQIDALNLYEKYRNDESYIAFMGKLSSEQKREFVELKSFIKSFKEAEESSEEVRKRLAEWGKGIEKYGNLLMSSLSASSSGGMTFDQALFLNSLNQLNNMGSQMRQNANDFMMLNILRSR